jgi:hypothetical protein
MPLSTAVEHGRRERSKRASDDRARDHVEWIADAGVNARGRGERRCHLERDCGIGISRATPQAKANADAA